MHVIYVVNGFCVGCLTPCSVALQVSNNPFTTIFSTFQLLLNQGLGSDWLWIWSILGAVPSFSCYCESIGCDVAEGKATGAHTYCMRQAH